MTYRAVPIAAAVPFALALAVTLWRTPFPLSESVGLFEDVEIRPVTGFLFPTVNYYRPLFHATLSALWNGAPSVETALAWVKLTVHILPAVLAVMLFAVHLRPRTATQAAASLVGLAALVGAPGLLGNLELALAVTIVGMPAAMGAWMLLERPRTLGGDIGIIALLLLALGFKEQGLVIAPLVIVAWWMGAPGAGRGTAGIAAAIAIGYVVFRLATRAGDNPPFEQAIGYGFQVFSPAAAVERWGAFPLGIYAYNALATIGTVLFAEPTEGVLRVTRAVAEGSLRPWHVVYVVSSTLTTVLICWWGVGELRRTRRHWSADARMFAAAVVAVAACGALSFAYSRDRMAGMAVPFYALAVYGAMSAAAERAARVRSRLLLALATLVLVAVSSAWQLRALYTVEFTRQRAVNNQREWLTDFSQRREARAGRTTYLRIMDAMRGQGTAAHGQRRTAYPRWLYTAMGEY